MAKAKTARRKTTKRAAPTRARGTAKSRPAKRAGGQAAAKAGARTSSRKTTRTVAARESARDAVTVLRSDHERVRKLFSGLEAAKSADRQSALLQKIEDELQLHTQLEEKIFYPAFHEAARNNEDRTMYYEALEEHHAVDLVLPEVKAAKRGTPQFAARAKVLKELVEHHAEEEEKDMFPRARKLMGARRLQELGREIVEQRDSAQAGVVATMASMLGMR